MYQSLQGNLGLGKAIEYFISQGYVVSIPLNDTQKYDLIVDMDGKVNRVSVKTSRQKTSETSYSVQLRNTGGASGNLRQRDFDNTTCDYLFIYTADESLYLIPAKDITAINSIAVGNKYKEYQVHVRSFNDFTQQMEN